MKTLDLKKNDIFNFERLEEIEVSTETWEQDAIRSWEFLKMTHTDEQSNQQLLENEVVCVRALLESKKNKRPIGSHEHIIKSFDETGFINYRMFIKEHLFNRDAVFNLHYNVFKIHFAKGQRFLRENKKKKMMGCGDCVASTNLLAVDLDAYSFEEYKEIRKLLLDKGIIPIEVSSGHGFHILVRIETCTDKKILAKWLKVLSDCGIIVDNHCKDPGRVYRLPFFYNIKKDKYATVVKAEVIEGEHGVPIYTVEDLFQRFGYDYSNWDELYDKDIQDKNDNTSGRANKATKKVGKKQENKISIEDSELEDLYPMLDIKSLPDGIRSMLKGFIEGHTYYQLMCLVLFFKRDQYSLEQILEIVTVTESINGGNYWNSWDTLEKAEGFYYSVYGMNMDELDNLETEFGNITFPAYDSGLKVPLSIMNPNELKVYLYLLRFGKSRKNDIINFLHISPNKLNRIMSNAILVCKKGLDYIIMDKKVKNYLYLSEEELDTYLQWNENEIAVYLYLKFRCGKDDSIQTSRESIEKGALVSHTTVTKAVHELENRNVISVVRKENQHHLIQELRESNIYTLLQQQSS